jgi:hypothetical protein
VQNLSTLGEKSATLGQNFTTLVQNLGSLMQNFTTLVQNLGSLMQNFTTLVQNLATLVQNFATLVQDRRSPVQTDETPIPDRCSLRPVQGGTLGPIASLSLAMGQARRLRRCIDLWCGIAAGPDELSATGERLYSAAPPLARVGHSWLHPLRRQEF